MSYLSLHNISKVWGQKIALNDISFDVKEGEFLVLLGPSGCGKSTMLRIIAGLEQADSGAIYFQQSDVTALTPSQRKLSMVFQSYALFPHLSVRENLLFGLRARGEDQRHFASRLAEVSSLMELDTLLERLPAQLSGGQQQRVALGRAVIANNRLCLMDEPLSNLDAKLRQNMRREIRGIQKKLGLTMVYVTHDQTEAMSMADKIILINEGAIEQHDTPDNLYNNPATAFSAQFIGAPPMNLIPLSCHDRCHYLGDMRVPLVDSTQEEALSLGLRAEDIQLTSVENGIVTGQITSYEYMGADTLVVCQLDASNDAVTVKVPGMKHFTDGCTIGLRWPPPSQYFFSTTTGKRCYSVEQKILPLEKRYAV